MDYQRLTCIVHFEMSSPTFPSLLTRNGFNPASAILRTRLSTAIFV
jgi:hypothetical protein